MNHSLALTCLAALFLVSCSRPEASRPAEPGRAARGVPVRVEKAVLRDVPVEILAIGNVEAFASVAVKSRVAGQILKVHFADAQDVREGDMLFELDPEPFREQARLAEANILRDRATERQAMASAQRDAALARNARQQADRYASLMSQGIVAKESADQMRTAAEAAEAALAADQAAVDSARAALRADEVRLAEAKLQLSYTAIRAPIGGRAGFISVKEGNLVKENDTSALVVIHRVEPVYVSFSVPEQSLPDIRKHMAAGALAVEVVEQARERQAASGRLTSFDNAVDASTGTIRLKATFANSDRSLWPGQFVNVRLRLRIDSQVLTVPSRAVQNGLKGQVAWAVMGDGTVESRIVQVARTYRDLAVVTGGLTEGEVVVTEGQLRLRKGETVEILNKP